MRATLNQIGKARLYNFLDSNKDRTRSHSAEDLAKLASEELKIDITPVNVRNLRALMGLGPYRKSRVTKDDTTRILADEIIKLHKELNTPLSDRFRRTFCL